MADAVGDRELTVGEVQRQGARVAQARGGARAPGDGAQRGAVAGLRPRVNGNGVVAPVRDNDLIVDAVYEDARRVAEPGGDTGDGAQRSDVPARGPRVDGDRVGVPVGHGQLVVARVHRDRPGQAEPRAGPLDRAQRSNVPGRRPRKHGDRRRLRRSPEHVALVDHEDLIVDAVDEYAVRVGQPGRWTTDAAQRFARGAAEEVDSRAVLEGPGDLVVEWVHGPAPGPLLGELQGLEVDHPERGDGAVRGAAVDHGPVRRVVVDGPELVVGG